MTCASQMGKHARAIKNFLQRDNTIKNVYLLELVEV